MPHTSLRSSFVASVGGSLTSKSMPTTFSNFLPPAATLGVIGKAENITRRHFELSLETSLWLFGIDIITDASGSRGRT